MKQYESNGVKYAEMTVKYLLNEKRNHQTGTSSDILAAVRIARRDTSVQRLGH